MSDPGFARTSRHTFMVGAGAGATALGLGLCRLRERRTWDRITKGTHPVAVERAQPIGEAVW